MRFQLVARTGHPDFLDLPWQVPLEDWDSPRLVQVAHGISRHVVRFVDYDGTLYALKELPRELAEREYRLLGRLTGESIPAVKSVGVVSGRTRDGEELEAVLITRYLDFSLPYRMLFTGRGVPNVQNRLLDALAELLARLHLAGFFWGDCSLSNTLFRRDAGALAAYVVDTETSELHDRLSDGQRLHDLIVAEENVAGELLDVAAASGEVIDEQQAFAVAGTIRSRYEGLWCELTAEDVFAPTERYRIDERLRRLNELGFDVDEVEVVALDEGFRLSLNPHVVEPGHHRRRLHALTGLNSQENQARRLLNDLARFRDHVNREEGRTLPESVVAYRWLAEVFEPVVAAIPPELIREKLEAAEIFHEVVDHRLHLSEQAGADVPLLEAARSYVDDVLRHVPDERTVLISDPAPTD